MLKHPAVLLKLAQAGEEGIVVRGDSGDHEGIKLCGEWGFRIRTNEERAHLIFDRDQLVSSWIREETPSLAWDHVDPHGYLSVGSTNTEAHELARLGAPGGTLVFAEEQTAGKGRQQRAWHSPRGAGLYCTLILRPAQAQMVWPLLTHTASVALAETLESLVSDRTVPVPLDVDIKWPNDVLIRGRKCAGILLEALRDDYGVPAALIGFGINVRKGSVPELPAVEATCLDEEARCNVPRRLLLVRFLDHFQRCYSMFERGDHGSLLERWKQHSSMWEGSTILVGQGDQCRKVVTCGLNEIGALVIRSAEGNLEVLLAEDVRIFRSS
jgi:BirA family biotin operon repressor/biotin-[acetyl-CoA-carboxylase] ligase